MKRVEAQLGNPALAAELAGLPIDEVSERCTSILMSKTIPVERLELLLDNMTRATNRVASMTPASRRGYNLPQHIVDDVIDLRDAA